MRKRRDALDSRNGRRGHLDNGIPESTATPYTSSQLKEFVANLYMMLMLTLTLVSDAQLTTPEYD